MEQSRIETDFVGDGVDRRGAAVAEKEGCLGGVDGDTDIIALKVSDYIDHVAGRIIQYHLEAKGLPRPGHTIVGNLSTGYLEIGGRR